MGTLGLLLALVFFIAGLAGTILPVLPGAPLIWVGMLVYGLFAGFSRLSWSFYLLQGVITIFVLVLDYLSTAWGAKKYGGSRQAIWGAIIGGLAGVIFFGPVGIIAGPFLGAVIVELISSQRPEEAVKAGFGTLIGFLGGSMLKLAIEVVMIIWFFVAIF